MIAGANGLMQKGSFVSFASVRFLGMAEDQAFRTVVARFFYNLEALSDVRPYPKSRHPSRAAASLESARSRHWSSSEQLDHGNWCQNPGPHAFLR